MPEYTRSDESRSRPELFSREIHQPDHVPARWPVSTPVWFAIDGDRLVVWSAATSGKIKRLRHTERVMVAACDIRGRVTGEEVEGVGKLLPAEEGRRAQQLLDRRYGLTKRAYSTAIRLWNRSILRRPAAPAAYIELSFPAGASD